MVSSYLGQSCCLLVLPTSSELDDFEGCFLEGHCLYFEGWCSEAALDRVEVQGQITGSWVRDYWQDWGSVCVMITVGAGCHPRSSITTGFSTFPVLLTSKQATGQHSLPS